MAGRQKEEKLLQHQGSTSECTIKKNIYNNIIANSQTYFDF